MSTASATVIPNGLYMNVVGNKISARVVKEATNKLEVEGQKWASYIRCQKNV